MRRGGEGRRRWLRTWLVGLAAAGVGSGCRSVNSGGEMTPPRPMADVKPEAGFFHDLHDSAFGQKGAMTGSNQIQ